jgi:hypothetical protein
MENFILYITKACGLIAVFFTAYQLLLKKETFFSANRFFLLAGLFTSVIMPLVTYTTIVWVEPTAQEPLSMEAVSYGYAPLMQSPIPQQEPFEINWWYVALGFYIMGTAFFIFRFIADFFKIYSLLNHQKIIKDGNFKLINSSDTISPFSFFNYIIYNSALLQPYELESILAHEKVHSRQKHSADMIISQLFCTLFWFNPMVWLYKKAIAQNLEFIADAETTKVLADKTAYQKTLLKITLPPECIAITNHFYQSLIKKRIIMLNTSQSKTSNYWRYMPIVPVLAAFIFLFQAEVIAQKKNTPPQPSGKTQAETKVKKSASVPALHKKDTVENNSEITDYKKALILINGIKQPIGKNIKLPENEGVASYTVLDKKEALKKYGKVARHGAVEITSHKNASFLGALAPETPWDNLIMYLQISENMSAFDPYEKQTVADKIIVQAYEIEARLKNLENIETILKLSKNGDIQPILEIEDYDKAIEDVQNQKEELLKEKLTKP